MIIGRNDKVVWVPVVVVGAEVVVDVVVGDGVVVDVVVCDPAVVDEVPVKYKYNCFLIKRMVFEF